MQDSSSFWTDIKNLEEQLAKAPDSFCFARLSEIYLKVGLVDDALHIARQGVMKYPRYVSGQRALALACHAKGLQNDACAALQLVVEALPEEVSSQKLFGRLLVEAGNLKGARQAFRNALEFAPDDVECRIELESVVRSAEETELLGKPENGDDEIIEDIEILEEIEVVEEDPLLSDSLLQQSSAIASPLSGMHHDPLSTATLAELYISQGFIDKARNIYLAILADNPADRTAAERLAEIEKPGSGTPEAAPAIDDGLAVAEGIQAFISPDEDRYFETVTMTAQESSLPLAPKIRGSGDDSSGAVPSVSDVPSQGIADNACTVLEGWLDNIRRLKSCR
jgi:tetratricopeptide (TPR) repeat protein